MKQPRGLDSCAAGTQLLEVTSSTSDRQEKLFTVHKSDLGAGARGLRSVVHRQILLIKEC